MPRTESLRPPRRLGIVAPFSLPYLIDPRDVHAAGRSAARREIVAAMSDSRYWRHDDRPENRRFVDFNAELAERLRDAAPDWVITADVAQVQDLLEARAQDLCRPFALFDGRPLDLRLRAVRLGIAEFGFGATTLDYAVEPRSDVPAGVRRREIADHEFGIHLLDLLAPVLREVLDDFTTFLPGRYRLETRHRGAHLVSEGVSLWNHNLVGHDQPVDRVLAEEGRLVPVLDPQRRARVPLEDSVVVPGLGTTLVCGLGAWDRVAETMSLAQAYYASTASTERALLRITATEAGRRAGSRRIGEAAVRAVHERIEIASLFAQSLGTLDAHLAASTVDETRVWQALYREWAVARQQELIGEHLSNLREAAGHLQRELGSRRQRLLGEVAFVFAAVAVVSTVFDLFDFSQGASLARPDSGRVTIALLSVSLLALALTALLRRRD